MQDALVIDALPTSGIDASAAFFANHLEAARTLLGAASTDALAIVMPPAQSDHDDWRLALARDLAREFAPKRVNVVGGGQGETLDRTLAYLGNAPGVTGQYIALHG